ncbi:MAG: aminodeoxychorismate synthase component I [Epsilonproteobacteria bacterium]|nr:aminodeoxychorismate synthase component I [Campylobacterota bacterium]
MGFEKVNQKASKREPFLVICDFLAQNVIVLGEEELACEDVEFSMDEDFISNSHAKRLEKRAMEFQEYKSKFDAVIEEIKAGDTYLTNLTQPTPITTALTLQEIYESANAKFKLRYKDKFVCFSPERFIKIENDTIHTFPMKGTIDASISHAAELILANEKEMAEHVMVVDLLRNDLSIVASNVRVERFRYIDTIEAGEKRLLQVSSHICGDLENNWHVNLGDILKKLLPAGSISGTPKKSTLEIIERVEGYERGYFSGIFGYFDGKEFDSAVMIRFIEKTQAGYIYKSGGGITLDSRAEDEYNEMLDKVYLP